MEREPASGLNRGVAGWCKVALVTARNDRDVCEVRRVISFVILLSRVSLPLLPLPAVTTTAEILAPLRSKSTGPLCAWNTPLTVWRHLPE